MEELRNRRVELAERSRRTLDAMGDLAHESMRVGALAGTPQAHFDEIEGEFESSTGLNKVDIACLFVAIALQCARQYLLTKFAGRVGHEEAANAIKSGVKEHSNRGYQWYNPSLTQVIANPVPFDTVFGSPDFGLKLGGGLQHRVKTLGHDPLLGWIFGTANIATGTLTTWDFQSFHVKTRLTSSGHARDRIVYRARTPKVLAHTKRKLFDSGQEGKLIIGAAFLKEAIHLRSDVGSIAGLPLPIISSISPELALRLTEYGIDTANVGTVLAQAATSTLIDIFIGMLHRLLNKDEMYRVSDLYAIKTRRILDYSHLIASTSNVIAVALATELGHIEAMRFIDIGGAIVTLHRLVADYHFMHRVKEEFVFENFKQRIRTAPESAPRQE